MTGDSTATDRRPLLDWVLARFPDTPKTRVKQWIQAGRVTVDGKIVRKANEPMTDPGDKLDLLGRQASAFVCDPEWLIHVRLGVLYLDSSIAIVNKGAGMLSVPAPNQDICALSVLRDVLCGKLRPREQRPIPPAFRKLSPHVVHRIDQFTSGVFCMAMNPAARAHLIEQFHEHTIKREYVAYVDGKAKAPRGTWRHWLKLTEDEMRQFVVPEHEGKAEQSTAVEAITHYEVITEFQTASGVVSKLRLRLETGKRHQIRVQAAYEGLPLIGDRIYHPKYRLESGLPVPVEFTRQALHAEFLEFEHPDQHKRMSWHGPLPRDLRQLETTLYQQSSAAKRNHGRPAGPKPANYPPHPTLSRKGRGN
ncbi:MAG: RluA family pseudouridine synthase [Verrucomicrobiae bacterium]|nr:RluA family pseudouridine synthase [Verrucomicrobiae bacterium]